MRKIAFSTVEGLALPEVRLVYRDEEYSFDTEPKPGGCARSLLVNDLELMFRTEDQRVMFVAGYCPHPQWRFESLRVPAHVRGGLFAHGAEEIALETAFRITNSDAPFPVAADGTTGWVCVGDPGTGSDQTCAEFAPGCVSVLAGGRLTALWLHPDRMPRPKIEIA